MEVKHGHVQLSGLLSCLRYRIGNIMKFKIEKDLLALLPDHIDDLRASMSKELFSYFKYSYMAFEASHPMLGFAEVLHIKSKDDLIFRIIHGRAHRCLYHIKIGNGLSMDNFGSVNSKIKLDRI